MNNSVKIGTALICIMLSCLSVNGYAQKKKDILPYAYGNTIDMSIGPVWAPISSQPTAARKVCGSGVDFNMRYSYFFGKHFGAYAAFNLSELSVYRDSFLNRMPDDGYRYKDAGYSTDRSNEYIGVSAGAVYRYDFGRWSLRPRVGIGYTSFISSESSYYMFSPEKPYSDPEHVYIKGQSKNCISLEASVQLTFTLGSHFFFMAEAGGRAVPGKYMTDVERYETRTQPPANWVDAVLDANVNRYIDTAAISRKIEKNQIGDLLYVKLGIGWNIGWNRNVNNRYNR